MDVDYIKIINKHDIFSRENMLKAIDNMCNICSSERNCTTGDECPLRPYLLILDR